METQQSQIDDNLNIYFVIPKKNQSEDDCTNDMWQAYNKCCEHELQPEWISEEQCHKMIPTKKDVFVMEEFAGDTFEKLKESKCLLLGPRCLLTCFLTGEPIPEGRSPVFVTPMKDFCVCASGFTPDVKKHIQQLVEYMGGIFTKQLRSSVTHLVTNCVMSAKYETAVEMKIPLVTKEWVDAIWKENLQDFVKATDSKFNKYKCPVFMQLVVTSTNLPRRQKEEVKQIINDNGGTFMGALDGSKVKVVLAPENGPLSDKIKYAMNYNIACLKPDWVFESVRKGYALPFKNYLVKSTKACSTPEKQTVQESFNFSSISVIPCDIQQNDCVDESLVSTISNLSTLDRFSSNVITSLDKLSLSEAKLAGPFLDGCNIYLAGFNSHQKDKLNKILNVGTATRLDDISDALTHVIIGDENKASRELQYIKGQDLCPHILTLEWLEESIKLKRPAAEECFLYKQNTDTMKNTTEPQSPLSKRNLQMLQQPKRPPVPSFNIDKKVNNDSSEEQDLVQQYLRKSVASEMTMINLFQSNNTLQNDNTQQTPNKSSKSMTNVVKPISHTIQNRDSDNDFTVPVSQQSSVTQRIFEGLTFVVTGFNDDDSYVAESIIAVGGEIVSHTFFGIPDYGVVPKYGSSLRHTVNEIVTNLFIEDCINQDQIVEIMYYHKPICIGNHTNPLSNCVITMSMYTGVERVFLAALAERLGAKCQDILARKTNLEKSTVGSTHLICPRPEGNKYNAAVKWKLPAVTADWLKSCGTQLKLVSETPFLVGETIAPDRPGLNDSAQENISNENQVEIAARQIITPKRHLQKAQAEDCTAPETPLINKRLSFVANNTESSPFHLSTPESPYGQIFKPNPSPDTRKGWLKWVNTLPDLYVEEPPMKRRPPSTPLSELKRQLWEKLKNPEENTEKKAISKEEEATGTPISRKLDFANVDSPLQNNQISLQLAQLEEALQRTPSTPESRYSSSGDNGKKYNVEASYNMREYAKDSQPDTVVWEDPEHHIPNIPTTIHEELNELKSTSDVKDLDEEQENSPIKIWCKSSKPKFMLSGVKDRIAYESVIQKLGGGVSTTELVFDASATHLLCMRPARNEKMLGSIASGKWVLHCLYLRDSEQEGKFLDEEKYEWGNPKSKGIIPEPVSETEQAVAAAAYRWRVKLLKEPGGAFSEIVALLLVTDEKHDQLQRLIEAGGGRVVQTRPPYDTSPGGKKITHCFVHTKQVKQPIDWAMLASKGILCFLPQFLSEHLTAKTPLVPRECVIPEFQKYLSLLPK